MLKVLFPGTFDPPTLAHIKLIKRIAAFCDQLTVGIGENINKKKPTLTIPERIEAIQKELSSLSNVTVMGFSGLVINFAKEQEVSLLIRGLRSSNDFEYEMQMAMANRKLSGIETLFLMAEDEAHISSSLIRELASHGAPLTEFIPQHIEQTYQQRLQQKGK